MDKVAASGGYLMASVADRIIAAPFALIGSIGVIAQLPNVNRLLKKHDVDWEMLTAGQYKRTLTVFGENTEQGRQKLREELDDVHALFQEFVAENRPQCRPRRRSRPVRRGTVGAHSTASSSTSLRRARTISSAHATTRTCTK